MWGMVGGATLYIQNHICLTILKPHTGSSKIYNTYRAVEAFWPITNRTGQCISRSVSFGSPRFPSTVNIGKPRQTTAVTCSRRATWKYIILCKIKIHQKITTTYKIYINLEQHILTIYSYGWNYPTVWKSMLGTVNGNVKALIKYANV
jgi:hypothetical protein